MAVRFYFRKINIIGKENLPKNGAVVFAVNHPSALLDPLVIAIIAGRKLHYLAAAEYFGGKILSKIFQNQFNMIPVYRPEINQSASKEATQKMFLHCYDKLEDGAAIIIFPEGNSETERRIRKLKTGIVRMVKGAEDDKELSVPIVPIGINYTNPHRFQSDVLVSIGEPLLVNSNLDLADKEQVTAQTSIIEESMQANIIHIQDEQLETKIQRIEQIYAKDLQNDLNISNSEFKRKFVMTKDIIEAIEYFESTSSKLTASLYEKMDRYYALIHELPMHGRLLNYLNEKSRIINYLSLIYLLPFMLVGFIVNAAPYYFSSFIFKTKFLNRIKNENDGDQIKPVFGGSIAFGLGTIAFVVWYLIVGILITLVTSWWWSIIFVIGAYLTARIAVAYLRIFKTTSESIKLNRIIKKHPAKMTELLQLRSQIINELQEFTMTYLSIKSNKETGE